MSQLPDQYYVPPLMGRAPRPESVTSDLIWGKTGQRHAVPFDPPGVTPSGLRCGRKLANVANDVVVPIRLRQKPAFLGEARLMRGTRRSKKQRDFGPSLRGMMRKGETVHGAGHMEIGKQHMDTRGVDLKNAQSGFGVFGFDHF
jgi:hypothetical protein